MSAEKFTIFAKDGTQFSGTMEEVADSICARLGLPANSIVLTTQESGANAKANAGAGAKDGDVVLGAVGVMKTTKLATKLATKPATETSDLSLRGLGGCNPLSPAKKKN
jgi:hypothetical protein